MCHVENKGEIVVKNYMTNVLQDFLYDSIPRINDFTVKKLNKVLLSDFIQEMSMYNTEQLLAMNFLNNYQTKQSVSKIFIME